ncbi:Putative Short chain dehydrogenase [[Torrubiella] hemipterigena]|uniref:Putative Short chain dehydrogenase n=1 Tax=[Torrubiella] hemipterigena TaxID=1531966 RepID=A0A0A1THE0_9HYPO|nr:Putative Short chain dehydrogenase [[Torrubiella] hemipterigena]
MSDLRYDGKVAVVTGAGAGLGRAYAEFLAARGASVVVNDLGGSTSGQGSSTKAADVVVENIVAAGGKAVASYESVENGNRIIDKAIEAFGRIDILINNAGILRDITFRKMTDRDWDAVYSVHLRGTYKTTRAAWSHFRKQKYGRVIMTSSATGLYGNFGQSNYSAAKAGMIGFGETLAKEGAKYNILTNVIAPMAASRLSGGVIPPDLAAQLSPAWVVPVVAMLVHSANTFENGSIFEVGATHVCKLRWERSTGALLKPDETMTPGAVLAKWQAVNDFSKPDHSGANPDMEYLQSLAVKIDRNPIGENVRFDGRVAVVTGGGAGLGRAYSLKLAYFGAKVVVNDLADPDTVVKEIIMAGGLAVANRSSVENGDEIIKTAIDNFGRVDILINNAGILRDKAFANMTDNLWDDIHNVHLRGSYKCAHAAWPYMVKQKYGRIINTTSTSGTYGNFGQANYASAKTAVVGLSRSLAAEGKRYNILVNSIAPFAGTQLTRTVLPEELVQARKPDYVSGIVLALCSEKAPTTAIGQIFEAGCGWQARTRWQRSGGHNFSPDKALDPETVLAQWSKVVDFNDGRADNPELPEDSRFHALARGDLVAKRSSQQKDYLAAIERAQAIKSPGIKFVYTDTEVILYNLGLGATQDQLSLIYEKDPNFQVLPTYGVISGPSADKPFDLADIVPNFNFGMLLHGDQYLEIRKFPIPTAATLISYPRLIEVADKGKAAVVVVGIDTKDATTGEDVFYNEMSLFIRDSGGFGGQRNRAAKSPGNISYDPPARAPDFVVEEATTVGQAALYRLSGDRNPLHVDPATATSAGFNKPILHGLCSFGIAGKHIFTQYGPIKSIKARFAGTVNPGQTLQTEMWKVGETVVFQTKIKETSKYCMQGGGVKLMGGQSHL